MRRLLDILKTVLSTPAGRGAFIVTSVVLGVLTAIYTVPVTYLPEAVAQTFRSKLNTDTLIGRDTAGFGDTE